ncbi:hypothetical protein IQ266_00605 [filamentous cyanobacterium LEGE 11480]|uniref:Lipoprotein n=1 Tax=Romeriopsis navalis LEGE 11480 TaxID=2777977 RepID=A0A928VLW7_9CYAN|nr:hypothetical protein [Romeriopsis navalis]MBE9028254.1 hypothetical protein [Romeriopsis navalis LEGE 11480]
MKIPSKPVFLSLSWLACLVATPAAAQLTQNAQIYLDGIGSIQAGMTITEAEQAGGIKLVKPGSGDRRGCYYIQPLNAALDVEFMVFGQGQGNPHHDRIVRVDINQSSTITTRSGAGIGTTEAEIKAMYPGQIKVTGNRYTWQSGGNDLTYMPRDAADKKYSLIFETLNGKVTQFRSGLADAVAQVERCR